MALWMGIMIAGAFAWYAVKLGLYQMWAVLFNLLVAVYLAIHLRPLISELAGSPGGTEYCDALCMLVTAVAVFVVLHVISTTFLLGTFNVAMPRIIDTGGAALVGFLAGYLVWSFVGMLLCTTPVCRYSFVKEIGFDNKTFQQANMHSYLTWWCKLMDKVVLSSDHDEASPEVINHIITLADERTSAKGGKATEPNEPNQPSLPPPPPAESNNTAPAMPPP